MDTPQQTTKPENVKHTGIEHLNEDTKKALEALFRSKDADDDGVLDAGELEDCLYLMGITPTQDDVHFLLKHFDKNNDGKLQIRELVDNCHVLYAHSMNSGDLMTAFGTIDKNKDGYIRYTELYQILTYNGFMTGDEARKMISRLSKFDTNRDGKFCYAEFVQMFLSIEYEKAIKVRGHPS